jgi:hypothetical protein
MSLAQSWRIFRRMQDTVVAVAGLAYGGAALEAWRALPGAVGVKLWRLALYPGGLLAVALIAALSAPLLRRALLRHLWMSYRTGFGQSVISVLVGVGVLIALAVFSIWPILHGGPIDPRFGGAFAAYGAGIGLLLAEAILVRRIEADPKMRRELQA